MAKPKQSPMSGLGIFGIIVIAMGLFVGFIKSDALIAGYTVGAGIVLIILSLFLDRLDTIIGLLRQIIDRDMPDSTE